MMRRENNYFLIWTCLCCASFEHLHFPEPELIYFFRYIFDFTTSGRDVPFFRENRL